MKCYLGYVYSRNDTEIKCSDGRWYPEPESCNTHCSDGNHDGMSCKCNPGYRSKFNGSSIICVDINECSEGYDLCENGTTCINTIGDYYCQYSSTNNDSVEIYPGFNWTLGKNVPEQQYLLPNKSLVGMFVFEIG